MKKKEKRLLILNEYYIKCGSIENILLTKSKYENNEASNLYEDLLQIKYKAVKWFNYFIFSLIYRLINIDNYKIKNFIHH